MNNYIPNTPTNIEKNSRNNPTIPSPGSESKSDYTIFLIPKYNPILVKITLPGTVVMLLKGLRTLSALRPDILKFVSGSYDINPVTTTRKSKMFHGLLR